MEDVYFYIVYKYLAFCGLNGPVGAVVWEMLLLLERLACLKGMYIDTG
jgi:hypothetical protein